MTRLAKPPVIEGILLRLRPVLANDAAYIHGLRTNSAYNRYLSENKGNIADQAAWIERYFAREAQGQEIYYIIERLFDDVPCGTVRLYDINAERFTWGSWIIDENKTPKAALESAVLSFGVGFDQLGCERAGIEVRIANTHAEAFYRRLGMTEIYRTDKDIYFEYPRMKFEHDRKGYVDILIQEAFS